MCVCGYIGSKLGFGLDWEMFIATLILTETEEGWFFSFSSWTVEMCFEIEYFEANLAGQFEQSKMYFEGS